MGGLDSDHINWHHSLDQLPTNRIHGFKTEVSKLPLLGERDIIDLSVGEPREMPPVDLLESIRELLGDHASGYHGGRPPKGFGYAPVQGAPELRKAASKMLQSYGLDYGAEHILITAGSRPALAAAIYCAGQGGRSVNTPEPYWSGYEEIAQVLGRNLHGIPASEGWVPSADQIIAGLTESCGGLLINSPNNPSGHVIDKASLEAIATHAHQVKMPVMSDNAYEAYYLIGKDPTHVPFASVSGKAMDVGIEIWSFSKSAAACGTRIGFIATRNTKGLQYLTQVLSSFYTSPNHLLQLAIAESIDSLPSFGEEQTAKYRDRSSAFLTGLRGGGGNVHSVRLSDDEKPFLKDSASGLDICPAQGAIFQYIRFPSELGSSVAVARSLYQNTGVICIPGAYFGKSQDNCLRFSLTDLPSRMSEAGRRVGSYFFDQRK